MANLVVSPFFLHWTNDILQAFREVYRVLIPDGFFTGAMFACNTLKELRAVLEKAEMRRDGVLSPHVSPLPTPGAIGDALTVGVETRRHPGGGVHHHVGAVTCGVGGVPRHLPADAPPPGGNGARVTCREWERTTRC